MKNVQGLKTIPSRTTEPLPGSAVTSHIWDSSLKAPTVQSKAWARDESKSSVEKKRSEFSPRWAKATHMVWTWEAMGTASPKRQLTKHKHILLGTKASPPQPHCMPSSRMWCVSTRSSTLNSLTWKGPWTLCLNLIYRLETQSFLKEHINKLASNFAALWRISSFNPFQVWIGN